MIQIYQCYINVDLFILGKLLNIKPTNSNVVLGLIYN